MTCALPRVVAAITLVAATIIAAGPVSAIDHGKGQPGMCPNATGVTVVVDFQQLGGGVIVRCYPSATRGNGLDALKGAGFQIAGVQRWGESFICRIENRPSAVETVAIDGNPNYRELCIDTPPAAGYWSYWHAGNNCVWKYSQWGVKNRDVIPGGFEGWSFSLNATSDSNPQPRVAAVRPGTQGQACTETHDPGPTTGDPGDHQPTRTMPAAPATVVPRPTPSGDSGAVTPGGAAAAIDPSGDAASGPTGSSGKARGTPTTTGRDGKPRGDDPSTGQADGGSTVPSGRTADPTGDVTYTGGEDAPDVKQVLAEQSTASPWARWVTVGVLVALAIGGVMTARRRARVRES